MKIDKRLTKLAESVLKNSVKLKKGEKIYIEAFSASTKDLFNEFIRLASKMGATPFYFYNDNSFVKNLIENSTPTQIEQYAFLLYTWERPRKSNQRPEMAQAISKPPS